MEEASIAYKTCRPDEGGKPKCGLGCLERNLNVEIRGMPFNVFYDITKSGNSAASKHRGLALGRTYDLFIILEGVTSDEDRLGIPVARYTAKRLSECILESGVGLDQVYITNMVKCAPPKGRKASLPEIKACIDHLTFELAKTQPKVVLLVGAATLRSFNLHNEGGIFKNRGKIFDIKYPGLPNGPSFKVIPTFHPSMFLYKEDKSAEYRMKNDYRLAARIINNSNFSKASEVKKYTLIKNTAQFDKMIEDIKSAGFVAFDTESRGLNTRINPLITFSFCWGDKEDGSQVAVLPVYRHSPIPDSLGWHLEPFWGKTKNRASLQYIFDRLKCEVFENEKIVKAAHNMKYDWQVVRKWVNSELKGTLLDTLLMHHLLCEQRPHDLEYLADIEFGTGNYSARLEIICDKVKTWDRIPDHILWPYSAFDAENVWKLANLYNARLANQVLKDGSSLRDFYFNRVLPCLEAVVEIEWEGIGMDLEKLKEYKIDYENHQDLILSKLKKGLSNPDFNPLSTYDVKDAAIKAGFSTQITDRFKASGYSTGKEVLLSLASDWPAAIDILNYRTNRKMISTYLNRVLEEIDDDGRIRKSFFIHGTESGRLSCSFLHQVPKPSKSGLKNLRDLFVASPGCMYGYMDYKQIELKVFAVLVSQLTGDDRLVEIFFNPELDAHKKTASIILEIPEDKLSPINRELGKTFNFGALFGSAGEDLVGKEYEDISGQRRIMTYDQVIIGINRFHTMYPSVREFMELVPGIAREQGGVYINVFGRHRRLGESLFSSDPSKRASAERKLVNFAVQSAAAQINIDTMSLLNAHVKKFIAEKRFQRNFFRIVNVVHDSTMVEINEKILTWALKFMKTIAERNIPELSNKNFTVDLGVGKTWSEAESNKVKEL